MARFPYPHIGQITIAKEDGNCSESNIFDLVSQNGLGVTSVSFGEAETYRLCWRPDPASPWSRMRQKVGGNAKSVAFGLWHCEHSSFEITS